MPSQTFSASPNSVTDDAPVELRGQSVADRIKYLTQAQLESERLLGAIDAMLVGTDSAGCILRWNQRAEITFGIASSDVIGQPFGSIPIRWEDPDTLKQLTSSGQESVKRLEACFTDSDGQKRIIGFSQYPVIENGVFEGKLILGTDLTQHRVAERQVHNAQKLESVGQLAAGLAHEINTPMQFVGDNLDYVKVKFEKLAVYLQDCDDLLDVVEAAEIGFDLVGKLRQQAKRLKLDKLYAQIPEAIDDSIEGIQSVAKLVQAMKELSRPCSVEKTLIDINRCLETTTTVTGSEWKYVAKLEMDLDPELPQIKGMAGDLRQVFVHLIVNAAQAIAEHMTGSEQPEGLISIRTQALDEGVCIEISDTGGGIPDSIRDRVFDPFFTTKSMDKGTGQGLALAHSVIVQRHGGQITFDVQEGIGTTFTIHLPLDENSPASASVSTPASSHLKPTEPN